MNIPISLNNLLFNNVESINFITLECKITNTTVYLKSGKKNSLSVLYVNQFALEELHTRLFFCITHQVVFPKQKYNRTPWRNINLVKDNLSGVYIGMERLGKISSEHRTMGIVSKAMSYKSCVNINIYSAIRMDVCIISK